MADMDISDFPRFDFFMLIYFFYHQKLHLAVATASARKKNNRYKRCNVRPPEPASTQTTFLFTPFISNNRIVE